MSLLDIAIRYTRRGWRVVPVPHRSKNPGFKGWQQLRLEEVELHRHFNGRPQNIGVLLGEPSNWLIDVDLDHARAVALADEFLPRTPAIFGRQGKPRSHWLYRVSAPLATKKFRSKSAGMIAEVRSTGAQTVLPPSTHEKGETICWEEEGAEPALVDPNELLGAVKQLADSVLAELGERAAKPKRAERPKPSPTPTVAPVIERPDDDVRAARCLAAMLRMHMVDHNDGSSRLFAAACRAFEFDLDDRLALATIRQYARQRPFPTDWSDEQLLTRIRDAEKTCRRGQAHAPTLSDDGLIALGGHDPATGKLVLSPKRTLPTAQAFVREFHAHPDGCTLQCQAGMLLRWTDNRYVELEDGAVKRQLQGWLHGALRYALNRRTEQLELVDYESNPTTVNSAIDSIRAFAHLPATVASPSWLGTPPAGLSPPDVLPCRSMLLHLPSMRHLPPTPRFFTFNALEIDPDPTAPDPLSWHRFLHQLFDGDIESLDLLQEWFGYCLTGDTSQQKMMLVVGPRRSGKGTIARVLTRLVGAGNIGGPTTSSLAGAFGLQPLIGKTLAIVSDARFHGENIATVAERLLCISGEDMLTIDRKHMTSVTMKLGVDVLYERWRRWCDREGRQLVNTKQSFGRDLAAAVAGIKRRRGNAMQPFYEGIALKEGWE